MHNNPHSGKAQQLFSQTIRRAGLWVLLRITMLSVPFSSVFLLVVKLLLQTIRNLLRYHKARNMALPEKLCVCVCVCVCVCLMGCLHTNPRYMLFHLLSMLLQTSKSQTLIESNHWRLERWLSSQEHALLLQKIAQFPEPTQGDSQLVVTPAAEQLTPSSGFYGHLCPHVYTPTHRYIM